MPEPLVDETLTRSVIGAFFRVYNELDYGFLEAIYVEALTRELQRRGHLVQREVPIVIYFDGAAVGLQRVDMIVDGRLIVEVKSSHDLSRTSHRQLMAYLRGSELSLGLLLHFGPKPQFFRLISSRRARRPIRGDPRLPP